MCWKQGARRNRAPTPSGTDMIGHANLNQCKRMVNYGRNFWRHLCNLHGLIYIYFPHNYPHVGCLFAILSLYLTPCLSISQILPLILESCPLISDSWFSFSLSWYSLRTGWFCLAHLEYIYKRHATLFPQKASINKFYHWEPLVKIVSRESLT